jgi:hypothetical protein
MATLLQILGDAIRRLAGPGAADNAAHEVHRATRSVVDLDAQLHRMSDPSPLSAA